MNVLYGALASLFIGASDLWGSRASSRSGPLATSFVAFVAGGVSLTIIAALADHQPSGGDLLLGAVSGLGAALGLSSLYAGYARSSVAITAPVTAVTTAVIPLAVDLVRGDVPAPLAWAGIAIGLSGLLLATWAPHTDHLAVGIRYGVAGGVGFAFAILVLAETSADAGLWPVVPQRCVSAIVAALVAVRLRQPLLPRREDLTAPAGAGILGGLGIGSITLGIQRGSTTPVAVAGSFYPAVTIALRWLLDGDQLSWHQVVGLAAALAGVILIAVA
ncbi:MAG: EamA family transporter [Acidimicrobiales bacterium]